MLKSIDHNRRDLTRARIREHGKAKFKEAIDKAAASNFLRGKSWFSYDWLIRPNNFDKVLTGNFDNEHGSPNTNPNTGADPRKRVTKPTGDGLSADF